MAKNKFQKNLRRLMAEAKWEPRDLARAADVSENSVYRYLRGERDNPASRHVAKLAEALSERLRRHVSLDELLGIEKEEPDDPADLVPGSTHVQEMVPIPVVNGVAAAGDGGIADDAIVEIHQYPRGMLTHIPEGQIEACFFVEARGESMTEAKITTGDMLLVCPTVTVQSGDICVVVVGDEAMVKRVSIKRDETGDIQRLLLYSENPNFEPMDVTDQNARVVGKVMHSTTYFGNGSNGT